MGEGCGIHPRMKLLKSCRADETLYSTIRAISGFLSRALGQATLSLQDYRDLVMVVVVDGWITADIEEEFN